MSFQDKIDCLYSAFHTGEISRREYHDSINDAFKSIPYNVQTYVLRRIDKRTPGEFALQLYDTTIRERRLFELCYPHFGARGDEWFDHGISNDGKIIIETKGDNKKLDFLVCTYDFNYQVEVKYAPTQNCMTFKVADLMNYLSVPKSKLLVVASPATLPYWKTFSIDEFPETFILEEDVYFVLLGHDEMLKILEVGQRDTHKGFGGKPTVRVFRKDIVELFEPVYFNSGVPCNV